MTIASTGTALSSHDGHAGSSWAAGQLSGRQTAIVIGWGVLLWLLVALLIRAAPGQLFDRGLWTVALFATAWPNAWVTVWLTRRIARLSLDQLVPGCALACAAAMLCDGVALTWTSLYGPGARDLVAVGATLLWGVAAIIVTAFAAAQRGRG